MNGEQYLLIKLAEEANEVAQMALKTAQFGSEEVMPGQPLTNRQRLHAELNDLQAAIHMLNVDGGMLDYTPDQAAIDRKVQKVFKFWKYSISLGMVRS